MTSDDKVNIANYAVKLLNSIDIPLKDPSMVVHK